MPLGSGSLVIADRNTDQRPSNCAMGVLGCRCLLRCITRRFCSGAGTLRRQRGDAWIGACSDWSYPAQAWQQRAKHCSVGEASVTVGGFAPAVSTFGARLGGLHSFPAAPRGETTDTSSRLPYFLPLCFRKQPSCCCSLHTLHAIV